MRAYPRQNTVRPSKRKPCPWGGARLAGVMLSEGRWAVRAESKEQKDKLVDTENRSAVAKGDDRQAWRVKRCKVPAIKQNKSQGIIRRIMKIQVASE